MGKIRVKFSKFINFLFSRELLLSQNFHMTATLGTFSLTSLAMFVKSTFPFYIFFYFVTRKVDFYVMDLFLIKKMSFKNVNY